jgi:hypothetical protein
VGDSRGPETDDRYLIGGLTMHGKGQGCQIHISTKAFNTNFLAFRSGDLGGSSLIVAAMIANCVPQSD